MIVVLLEATRRSVGWPLPIIAVVLIVYALYGPLAAGHSRASRQHVEKRRQSPLSHEPGHLRHRARRRRDLRLPLRAVRRAGDARRARPLLHRSRDRADRPLLRRARQGLDLRLGPVRHDLGLVDRQHRDGRLAHHSGDDPRRLCAPLRRRRRGGGRNRRADHAADHGRGRVPDGRVSRGPYQTIIVAAIVPAFMHFFGVFCQIHFEAKKYGLRGLPDSELPVRARGHPPRLADRDAARGAADGAVLRFHALSRRVLGHHGLHRPRADQSQSLRRGRVRRGGGALHPAADPDRVVRPRSDHRRVDRGLGLVRADATKAARRGSSISSMPSWSAPNTRSASAPRPPPSASSSASSR